MKHELRENFHSLSEANGLCGWRAAAADAVNTERGKLKPKGRH